MLTRIMSAQFSTGTVGPPVGIFLFSLNTNDGFYLSYIPVGKIKNEKPHVGRTLIPDVILMLKFRHNVASQRIQIFLKSFFMFSNIN